MATNWSPYGQGDHVARPWGFNYPNSGLNNTAEYIASGLPYVTSSTLAATGTVRIDFPFVTNFITVQNISGGGDLFVGFTKNGVKTDNRFQVEGGDTFEDLRFRIKTLYLRVENGTTEFNVLAGLTQIPARTMPVLTGSAAGWNTGSVAKEFGYDGLG